MSWVYHAKHKLEGAVGEARDIRAKTIVPRLAQPRAEAPEEATDAVAAPVREGAGR
jgi:hypothetical protein